MSLGPAGIKPTEALLTASRRACPGGGGTKQLPRGPAGIKPTEALLRASRRARPGGGGTKQLPGGPAQQAANLIPPSAEI